MLVRITSYSLINQETAIFDSYEITRILHTLWLDESHFLS